MAGQNTPNYANVKLLEDAEYIRKLLPWIESQEDLVNFIRSVPLDHYDLRCQLTLLHFIKDRDAKESADFEQKIEDDAREILACLPDRTYREIKERLTALGSLSNRKEVVIRQILQHRIDLVPLVDQLDQNKKRKSDVVDANDEDTNIKIKIRKFDGTLKVVSSISQNNKTPVKRRRFYSRVYTSSSSSTSSSCSSSSRSSDSETDTDLKDLLGADIKTEKEPPEAEPTFNLVDYLQEVTRASRTRIVKLCIELMLPLHDKPKDPLILNDLLNRLMTPEVIDITDTPTTVQDDKDKSEKDKEKADREYKVRLKPSALLFDKLTAPAAPKRRNYVQPAKMPQRKRLATDLVSKLDDPNPSEPELRFRRNRIGAIANPSSSASSLDEPETNESDTPVDLTWHKPTKVINGGSETRATATITSGNLNSNDEYWPADPGHPAGNKDAWTPANLDDHLLPSTSGATSPIPLSTTEQTASGKMSVGSPSGTSAAKTGQPDVQSEMDNLWNNDFDWNDSDLFEQPPPHHLTIDDTDESTDEGGEPIQLPEEADITLVNRVMEMFPEACPKYIRRICSGKNWEQFDDIVTVILSDEDYPKRPARAPSPPKEVDPDKQFEIIKEFLPDADPNYLRMKCLEYGKDFEGLNEFVNNARESKDYPTLKEYLRKKQLFAQAKQYTDEFDVEKFVQLFSDPEKVFNDPKRAVEVDFYAKMYLTMYFENRYDKLSKKLIKTILVNNNYKILASDKLLKNEKNLMRTKRKKSELPDPGENILILQELAYLNHQKEIQEFIQTKKIREEQEFVEAKENGLLNECQCCFDSEIMLKNTVVCPKGCIVCKDCIIRSCEVNFGEGKLEFLCLNGCNEEYSLHVLQDVLPPKMFSKIAQKKALAEVKAAGIEELESCPFCDFATIPNENDKIFRCLNADCMKESCRSCKEPNHVPLRCDEVEQDAEVKNRVFIENKMTEALLRKCWKCGTSFFKEEGCNKMTCTCGAQMCYICKKPVTDYKHFNGIGGDQFHLCPLYSDTNKVNKENVLQAAEAAKAEVGPNALKVDPTADVATHFDERARRLPREPHIDQLMAFHERPMQQVYVYPGHGAGPPMPVGREALIHIRRGLHQQHLARRAEQRRRHLIPNRHAQANLYPRQPGHQ